MILLNTLERLQLPGRWRLRQRATPSRHQQLDVIGPYPGSGKTSTILVQARAKCQCSLAVR